MKNLLFFLKYLRYFITARNRHGIHSPFVYELLNEVIYDERWYYAFDEIEAVRAELLRNNNEIGMVDYGAGHEGRGTGDGGRMKIKDIARHSAKSSKYGQLLFRLVNKLQPQVLLELGTSLGISTLYQASPVSKSRFITLEGNPHALAIATENFSNMKLRHIEPIEGNFTDTLPKVVSSLSRLDYVFFDGNHRKAPTLDYFEQCIQLAGNNSVFVFDDIHWSAEMDEAWEAIKAHPRTRVTIDLFFLGLVFFREEQKKEHFVIRY